MNWFLNQAIYGTQVCDYAVGSVSTKEIIENLGFFNNTDQPFLPSEYPDDTLYETKTVLYRNGEFIVPQEVKISFDNGDVIVELWDGKSRSHDFTYTGTRKIVSVEIDPSLKIPLDKNLINNSYTTKPDSTGIWRIFSAFMTWMQGLMITLCALV